jgi:hypothetical protein
VSSQEIIKPSHIETLPGSHATRGFYQQERNARAGQDTAREKKRRTERNDAA